VRRLLASSQPAGRRRRKITLRPCGDCEQHRGHVPASRASLPGTRCRGPRGADPVHARGDAVHQHRRFHDRDAPGAAPVRHPGHRHRAVQLGRLGLHVRGRVRRLCGCGGARPRGAQVGLHRAVSRPAAGHPGLRLGDELPAAGRGPVSDGRVWRGVGRFVIRHRGGRVSRGAARPGDRPSHVGVRGGVGGGRAHWDRARHPLRLGSAVPRAGGPGAAAFGHVRVDDAAADRPPVRDATTSPGPVARHAHASLPSARPGPHRHSDVRRIFRDPLHQRLLREQRGCHGGPVASRLRGRGRAHAREHAARGPAHRPLRCAARVSLPWRRRWQR
jgi:hypothetical protein